LARAAAWPSDSARSSDAPLEPLAAAAGLFVFSEGIAGLGAAVLYLFDLGGCQYYKLFSLDVGFAAMIVITRVWRRSLWAAIRSASLFCLFSAGF